MAFKQGESLEGKGKLFPVFIGEDGNMYSVRCSEEELEMLQLMIPVALGGTVKVDPDPINPEDGAIRIYNKAKQKKI